MIEFQTMYNRLADGKALFFPTATYVSGKSFKVAGDWTAILGKGMMVALTNDSKENYSYILNVTFASGETTITTFNWNFYSGGLPTVDTALANSAITNVYISGTAQCGDHPGEIILGNRRKISFRGRTATIYAWETLEGDGVAQFATSGSLSYGTDVTFLDDRFIFGVIGNLGRQNGADPTYITDADGGTGTFYVADLLNIATTTFSVRIKTTAANLPTDWFGCGITFRGVIA